MAFALNTTVRQIAPVIEGQVLDVRYDAITQKFAYLVSYDLAGETQTRWFDEDQIQAA